jgi:hypothetical protein
MLERRQHPRNRVYYGGMIAFNARNSTLACVVRNVSNRGAKIEFDNFDHVARSRRLRDRTQGPFVLGPPRLARR